MMSPEEKEYKKYRDACIRLAENSDYKKVKEYFDKFYIHKNVLPETPEEAYRIALIKEGLSKFFNIVSTLYRLEQENQQTITDKGSSSQRTPSFNDIF